MPFVFALAAQGAGFALYEFSARTVGMGGSVMANDAEPASLAANPALITQLDGTQIQFGATAVLPQATTTITHPLLGPMSRDLEKKTFILPNFYLTHKINDRFSLGLGAFTRFGLAGAYENPSTWAAAAGEAYKVSLTSYSFTPTLAFKASDEVSLAAAAEIMYLDFSENPLLPSPPFPMAFNTKISGTGWSLGGNFALSYKPAWAEKWGFGLTYKTKMDQDLNGSVSTNPAPSAPFIGMGVPPSGNARGKVTLPDSIAAGLSFRPSQKLLLEGGITGTFWSSYDAIRIYYKNMPLVITDPKNYSDAVRLNLGGEYKLNKAWAVRAGYVYDGSPVNPNHMDTIVPVDDRHIFSAGLGYTTGVWGVDAAYAYLAGKDLTGTTNSGLPISYTNGKSHFLALSFKYAFK